MGSILFITELKPKSNLAHTLV